MADQQAPAVPGDPGPGEAHAAAATSSVTGFLVWLLSRYVFHGGPVPPEVTGFILVAVTYSGTWVAARLVGKRRAAKAPVPPPASDQDPPPPF